MDLFQLDWARPSMPALRAELAGEQQAGSRSWCQGRCSQDKSFL